MATSSEPLMRALGLDRQSGSLYERMLRQSGAALPELAAMSDLSSEELARRLGPLVEAGLVELVDDRVVTFTPAEAIGRLLGETAASAARAHHRLEELAGALPHLGSAPDRAVDLNDSVEPIDGEVEYVGTPVAGLRRMIEGGVGDLLWLRPDQWSLSSEEEMADLVAAAVAAGLRSRAIYPVRALTEASATLERRIGFGEEVRVLPELPTRLAIVGGSYAVMAEPLGLSAAPRTVVRQRGLVEALTLLFEELWRRAAPVGSAPGAPEPDFQRRFLLELLASGAQDEQIARRLAVSLRTVRRRVAELLVELGAESRFAAGVEAARRGLLS